jgi:hypothetical protein
MDVDENGNPIEPAAPAPMVIQQADPSAVADILLARLSQAGGSPAQQQSLLTKTIADLRASNFQDDFIEGIAKTIGNVEATINERINQAVGHYAENQKHEKASEVIRATIAQFAQADDLVAYSADAIFQKVVEKFNSDPAAAAMRHKFGRGEVDHAFFGNLAKEEVVKFYKKAGKDGPPAKGPAMKPGASTQAPTIPAADPVVGELNENARERYDSMFSLAKRSGLTDEAAKEKAMVSAKRFATLK